MGSGCRAVSGARTGCSIREHGRDCGSAAGWGDSCAWVKRKCRERDVGSRCFVAERGGCVDQYDERRTDCSALVALAACRCSDCRDCCGVHLGRRAVSRRDRTGHGGHRRGRSGSRAQVRCDSWIHKSIGTERSGLARQRVGGQLVVAARHGSTAIRSDRSRRWNETGSGAGRCFGFDVAEAGRGDSEIFGRGCADHGFVQCQRSPAALRYSVEYSLAECRRWAEPRINNAAGLSDGSQRSYRSCGPSGSTKVWHSALDRGTSKARRFPFGEPRRRNVIFGGAREVAHLRLACRYEAAATIDR